MKSEKWAGRGEILQRSFIALSQKNGPPQKGKFLDQMYWNENIFL